MTTNEELIKKALRFDYPYNWEDMVEKLVDALEESDRRLKEAYEAVTETEPEYHEPDDDLFWADWYQSRVDATIAILKDGV